MDASLFAFVPVPIELKGHIIGRHRVVLNEMIELSGTTIDPGSRDQPGFTITGNEEGIEMAKQLISKKLVSSLETRYCVKINITSYCVLREFSIMFRNVHSRKNVRFKEISSNRVH